MYHCRLSVLVVRGTQADGYAGAMIFLAFAIVMCAVVAASMTFSKEVERGGGCGVWLERSVWLGWTVGAPCFARILGVGRRWVAADQGSRLTWPGDLAEAGQRGPIHSYGTGPPTYLASWYAQSNGPNIGECGEASKHALL